MSQVLEFGELGRFHSEYYLPNRPTVIRGLARGSSQGSIFDWSLASLTGVMGDKTVPVMATQTGFLSYERNFVDMPFSEFAERMLAPDPKSGLRYYYKNPTKLLPAEQQSAVHLPELREYTAKSAAMNLWISGSGLTVGLHYDPADNLNFQIRGRKSFTLYPPGIRPYYPLPMFSQTAHISGVFRSGPEPDLTKFPRFDPSTALHFELEAGDVLYIPAYWWHQVRSLGDENLNLNFWWFPKLAKQLVNWNQALRGHIQLGLRYLKYGNIQQAPADSAKSA